MASTPQDPDLGILLGLAYEQFVVELRASLTEHGFDDLGRSDGYVFRCLTKRPMNVSELAERLGITKQGAAQIVDDMQRRGYVERRPDPADGRAKLLYLTERGNAALAAARRYHRNREQRLAREFGPDALRTLRAVLGAVATEERLADPQLRALYV
ncbi:MarR family winged helix-turn-helix transcriptional regulator [Nocardia bhagyanarayanae]|uniref:MarR family transcriptional regulator n=1 Tax=Nocardia bhagyanarayanae TaxID=1215925 RepID=A0A543F8Y0_9NOCA|nr:MarR family transcriptional regulator [Nocardia bhagyanarayanae]TQM30297.1 MarR family transcriptional regulator [Nocardia bhagyanarayanae]